MDYNTPQRMFPRWAVSVLEIWTGVIRVTKFECSFFQYKYLKPKIFTCLSYRKRLWGFLILNRVKKCSAITIFLLVLLELDSLHIYTNLLFHSTGVNRIISHVYCFFYLLDLLKGLSLLTKNSDKREQYWDYSCLQNSLVNDANLT